MSAGSPPFLRFSVLPPNPTLSGLVFSLPIPISSHPSSHSLHRLPTLLPKKPSISLYLIARSSSTRVKSFQLDRKSGKKCYMLAARALTIIWGDTEEYWNWTTMPESRFPEVAQLVDVCWLEIRGMINTFALSPNTQYAAYLVFKMIDARGFANHPVNLSVGNTYGHSSTKIVCLDPNVEGRPHNRVAGLQRPSVRRDGWLEIEMGEFFNSGLEDEEMQMSVIETRGGH